MTRKTILGVVICLLVGCNGKNPAAPTPRPPTLPTFSLVAETPLPNRTVFWLEQAAESTSGQIAVHIHAQTIPGQFVRFSKFRGTLFFDDRVLKVLNYTEGEFMRQSGAAVDAFVSSVGSRVTMRLDRPDSVPGATGTGIVLTLRFVRASEDVWVASSPLQWDDPHAYTASFSDILFRAHGGTIHVALQ